MKQSQTQHNYTNHKTQQNNNDNNNAPYIYINKASPLPTHQTNTDQSHLIRQNKHINSNINSKQIQSQTYKNQITET